MLKTIAVFSTLAVLSVPAQAATLPGNAAEGKKLHDAKCTACHTDSVYRREDRRVSDLSGIVDQITACGHQTDVTLEKDQINNLVKYLNETYYKFK